MTEPDITALVKRLRDPSTEVLPDHGILLEAADALEALQHTQDMFTADFNDCNRERARWKARAEKAEAALAQHVVSCAPQPTTEAKNSMPDIADFADELETLVREMLDAGVDRAAVKETLTAKLQELTDEETGDEGDAEEPPEGDTA